MQTPEDSAPTSRGRRGTVQFAFSVLAAFIATGGALSQESSPIRRIQTNGTVLTRDWLAYSVDESLESMDFNGDADTEDRVIRVQVFATGEETLLPLAVACLTNTVSREGGDRINVPVSESAQGLDLNGDGDLDDVILHTHDVSTGETVNQGLDAPDMCVSPTVRDFEVSHLREAANNEDLNGDGDEEDVVIHIQDLIAGETRNLQLALAGYADRVGQWVVFAVSERGQMVDLNGDGDVLDAVLHVHGLSSGTTTNVGLSVAGFSFAPPGFHPPMAGDKISVMVVESAQGLDLNGDKDTDDQVVHVHTLSTGETTNLGLNATFTTVVGEWVAVGTYDFDRLDLGESPWFLRIVNIVSGEIRNLPPGTIGVLGDGDWLSLQVKEDGMYRGLAEDLNGDGDTSDDVGFLYNVVTNELTQLPIPWQGEIIRPSFPVLGNHAELWATEWAIGNDGNDINDDGDVDDTFAYLVDLERLASLPRFLRGDWNADGGTDLSDAVFTLNWLFLGGPPPSCPAAVDTNGDNAVDITDPTYLLTHLFLGGPPPAAPFPECGTSNLGADEDLGCDDSSCP